MRAVSNTSPISALAYIGRLPLLRSQFTEIWIPPAVSRELQGHPDASVSADIQEALRANRIHIRAPSATPFLLTLLSRLDLAEAEAIALAVELSTDIVLLDEQEGRRLAAHAGLSVTGTLGVLMRARLKGEISALKPEIQALRARAHFFVSKQLESETPSIVGE